MARAATALAVAVLVVLSLAGCGSGEEDTTSTPSQGTTAEREPTAPQSVPNSSRAKQDIPAPPAPNPHPGSKRAAPGVPVSAEGDNSIQLYGVEASDAERARLTALVQSFLNARAAGNWTEVCSLLAAKPRAEQLRFAPGAKSCAQAMAYFAKDANPAILREEAQIEVLSLRVDPPIAFLIYRRSDQSIWATALEREGGEWKVISVTPAPVG